MSVQETIRSEISSTEALTQLSPQCIVEYLSKEYAHRIADLLESFTDEELIKHLGGINQILDDHQIEAVDYVGNINASNEQDAKAIYAEDGL